MSINETIKDFVAFDLETTGFSREYDGITQIGAIRVKDGKIMTGEKDRFNKLVYQGNGYGRRIPPDVVALTGITNEMVSRADPIEKVLPEFLEFAGDDILVGYNCDRFDSSFLYAACRHCNTSMNNRFVDGVYLAKKYIRSKTPGCLKYNLGLITELLGLKNEAAHNAYYDAYVTAQVYLRLCEENIPEPVYVNTTYVRNEKNVDIRNKDGVNPGIASYLDKTVEMLWQMYPDGVLPDTLYKFSSETGIVLYEFRKKVKAAYGIRFEQYLAQCGFTSIPLS